MEQDLINRSVRVDLVNRITISSLPLLFDPVKRLAPNKEALCVYHQQLRRKLNQCLDVTNSKAKLRSLGHIADEIEIVLNKGGFPLKGFT